MPGQTLPSLLIADRPAQAKRVWLALVERATVADTPPPIMPLRQALAAHQLHVEPPIDDRIDDAGYLMPLAMASVVNGLWPSLSGADGDYDLSDATSRHSYQFRQRLSQYLRGTVNAVCVQRGSRSTASRWWFRTEWYDGLPRKFVVERSATVVPEAPTSEAIELMNKREQNSQLRQQLNDCRLRVERLEAMLRAITE